MNEIEISNERLKELINSPYISKKDLSKKLGINRATIYKWINSDFKKIKMSYVKKIATIYQVNSAWLMGYDVPKEIETEEHSELRKRLENKLLNASTEDLKQVEKFIDTFLEELKK